MKKIKLPKIIKSTNFDKDFTKFPLKYYSYSSLCLFSSNPLMFKIKYINQDKIDTLIGISAIIGQAFHTAMETYYTMLDEDESEAIKLGLESGGKFLEDYGEGWIQFSSKIPTKQKAIELFTFAYNSYINEKVKEKVEILGCEVEIKQKIDVEWRGQKLVLPVPLKGFIDKIIRQDGKLKIVDYKTCSRFSDTKKIEGRKILQAIQYYLLVYAEYGEEPYSFIFEEVKTSKNKNEEKQVLRYEIIYNEVDLFFDFYFRFYEDVTRSINGESVFPPNIDTFFDNEISIVSYINKLDQTEEQRKLMEKFKVDNITNLLKKKLELSSNIKKIIGDPNKFEFKTINYNNMDLQEKIKMKFREHGMLINYEDRIDGYSYDLLRFEPSIGLKMNKIKSYVADIEQVVGVSGIRVLAPIPNTSLIGFEIPREDRVFPKVMAIANGFNLAIGLDFNGEFRFDVRQAPHMLISGATGSGKSVFLNSIISQLLTCENTELHLFDPKIVELSQFKNESKVIEYFTETEDICLSLQYLVEEMNQRYKKLQYQEVRNISEYVGEDMPYKFIVIDEFSDLVLSSPYSKEIKNYLQILAQKSRACGIHLIISTQRPSVKIITGDIKANFPTKVAFRCAKAIDSQVVIGESGAEKLLGKGDMIFQCDEGNYRLQGFNC